MPNANSRSPRRWNPNTILKGIIVLLIIALAMRPVFRSYQQRQSLRLIAELKAAIASGDIRKTEQLLEQKIDLNSQVVTSYNGGETNILGSLNSNPMQTFTKEGLAKRQEITYRVLKKFLEEGGDPNRLLTARNSPKAIALLLSKGAKADMRASSGRNALFYTFNFNAMGLLIDAGADVNAKSSSGETPLLSHALSGSPETIGLLLDKGARLEDRDSEGRTPMLEAARFGRWTNMELLLKRGADVRAADNEGKTTLMLVTESGKRETMEMLLKRGTDVRVADNEGRTALMLAAQSGKRETVELLMKHGADIYAKDKQGKTLLNYAIGDITLSEKLLKKGIRYHHAPDGNSSLPFTLDKRGLALLLRCGFKLNLRNNVSGNTALLQAAIMQNQILLVQVPRSVDATPERRAQLAKAIQANKAKVGDETKFIEAADFLLENGANPNLANNQGWTPLLAATANNNLPLVKLLLAHGANIHQPMPPGITPLRIAQAYGYTEIEQLLRDKGA